MDAISLPVVRDFVVTGEKFRENMSRSISMSRKKAIFPSSLCRVYGFAGVENFPE
jgi:hypothetical protein